MSKIYDVVVLTEDRYENPANLNWYSLQVLLEDELVRDALEQQGLNAIRKSWSNPDFDWTTTKAVIFRTTWDYFDRFSAFEDWLKRIQDHVEIINPPSIIHWNLDKRYLLDLMQRGVNAVATEVLPQNSEVDLTSFFQHFNADEFIVKPVISGAARHTYRVNRENVAVVEQQLNRLLQNETMIAQPFQNNIVSQGEMSLMIMGGQFSHAVIKRAKQGDFRVQDDHGGMVQTYSATAEEIAFAEKAIAACDPSPLYGRVDMIRDNDNQLSIMELELIEPELFLRFHRPAATQLAIAVKDYLQNHGKTR